jgi:chromate transporter
MAEAVPFRSALRVWTLIGLASFGGPAAQISLMHRVLVDEKRWIGESRFTHALNFCMLLPGPEAMQLATYIGWLMHGYRGGIAAGLLFVLPGFVAILALSLIYTAFGDVALVEGLFFGLKAAVLAVVLEALARIGSRILKNSVMVTIAALAFVGIFFLTLPFPLIVAAALLLGYLGGRFWPAPFAVVRGPAEEEREELLQPSASRPFVRTIRVASVWLAIWFVPVAALVWFTGIDSFYTLESLFFSKAAVVTFGGAYAVLAYIAQQAVEVYGWLQPGEMLDGLGMAETTPGPLIQVVQFVGYMGAYRDPGALPPWLAGVFGSVVVTWVTFVPCFLWIFLGAPYMERIRGNVKLQAALSAVTAAVLGVILNLALWFGIHALFSDVAERTVGPLRLLVPKWSSLDVAALVIAAAASLALLRLHTPVIPVILAGAVAGVFYRLVLAG